MKSFEYATPRTVDEAVEQLADKWGEITNDCRPFPYGQWNIPQWSATCDRLIGTWTTFVDESEAIRAAFLEGPFSAESTGAILKQWAGQIHDATSEAAATHQASAGDIKKAAG